MSALYLNSHYYLIHDEIELYGLKNKPEYNGRRGTIIKPIHEKHRYLINIKVNTRNEKKLLIKPINIKRIGNGNHVYSESEAIKKYGSNHGNQSSTDSSRCYFAGSLIEKQKLMNILFNSGNAYLERFEKLSIEDQRDVLLNKKQIWISEDIQLLQFVKKYTGSNGAKCDGCSLTLKQYLSRNHFGDDAYDDEDHLDDFIDSICPDCCYSVCEDCVVHCSYYGGRDRGTCFCKDSNFGHEYDVDLNKRKHYQHGIVSKKQREEAEQLMIIRWELAVDGYIRINYSDFHQFPDVLKDKLSLTFLEMYTLIE